MQRGAFPQDAEEGRRPTSYRVVRRSVVERIGNGWTAKASGGEDWRARRHSAQYDSTPSRRCALTWMAGLESQLAVDRIEGGGQGQELEHEPEPLRSWSEEDQPVGVDDLHAGTPFAARVRQNVAAEGGEIQMAERHMRSRSGRTGMCWHLARHRRWRCGGKASLRVARFSHRFRWGASGTTGGIAGALGMSAAIASSDCGSLIRWIIGDRSSEHHGESDATERVDRTWELLSSTPLRDSIPWALYENRPGIARR